jgi:hypothetical protein
MYIAGADSDHGVEIDGPEGTAGGSFTFTNGTLIGMAAEMADFRDSAMGSISNVYFTGFADGGDLELDDNGSSYNYSNGLLNFSNFQLDLSGYTAGTTLSALIVDKSSNGDAFASGLSFATAVTAGNQTVGADESKFSWTFAAHKGAF